MESGSIPNALESPQSLDNDFIEAGSGIRQHRLGLPASLDKLKKLARFHPCEFLIFRTKKQQTAYAFTSAFAFAFRRRRRITYPPNAQQPTNAIELGSGTEVGEMV